MAVIVCAPSSDDVGDRRGVGGAVGPGAAGCRPAFSSRLESLHSKVTSAPWAGAVVIPCRCRVRTCPICGPRLGWLVRQTLLSKAYLFHKPHLFTLTVDRSRFAGPEDAHTAISQGHFVSRLLRSLGVRVWFWVLEFQTKTGEGWPHWHVLIDLADCPGERIDLKRAWRLWRDKWRLGGLDLSDEKEATDTAHAIMYVTKYVTKMPEAFPEWVLTRPRAIHFVAGCRALGSLTNQQRRVKSPSKVIDQRNLPFRLPRRPLVVRMARCQKTSVIMAFEGDLLAPLGASWSYLGRANVVPDDLPDLAEQGLISARFDPISFGDSEILAMGHRSGGGVGGALARLPAELADPEVGYAEEWEHRAADRQSQILADSHRYWSERTAQNAGEDKS